ncbi:MAG: choice-of-anchor L domain-containing protein, partial [Bacteroidota bacterium]|nr:choice-of-anchor L domain-containing protein [Bacteroidota bacterium]
NSSFNDVFGFFLSGPGINGPYSNNAENIALLPNGQPVTIDNLFNNQVYYEGSTSGSGGQGLAYNDDIEYDGASIPLTAEAEVQICETYHIKLAIGDAGDSSYDSGVFFQAGSFMSGEQLNSESFNSWDMTNGVYEGCQVYVYFEREDTLDVSQDMDVELTIGGDASMGNDYDSFSNIFTIPAGMAGDTLIFDVYEDGTPEGMEYILLSYEGGCPCDPELTLDTIYIYDEIDTDILMFEDGPICEPGDEATLSFTYDPSIDPNVFSWTWLYDDSHEETLTVTPSSETTYYLEVSYPCDTETHSVTVQFSNPQVDLGPDQDVCDYDLPITLDAGAGFVDYAWSTGENSETINPTTTGTYVVTVTDDVSCTATDEVNVTVHAAPTPDLGGDYSECDYDIPLSLDAGAGDTYNWSTGEHVQVINVNSSGTYSVTVTDEYGCEGTDESNITITTTPVPDLGDDISVCDYDVPVTLNPGTGSGFDYEWSGGENTTTISVDESGIYAVTVTEGDCWDADSIEVTVNDAPIPDLGDDLLVCEYDAPFILDAGAGAYFDWSDGTTTQTNNVSSSDTYSVTVTSEAGCTGTDEVNLVVNPNLEPDAGDDQFVCDHQTTMEGSTTPSDVTGTWQQLSGPGTLNFFNPNNPTTTVTVDIDGEYEVMWYLEYDDGSGCWASDTVVIELYENLDPTITDIPDMCISDPAVYLEIEDEGTVTTSPDIDDAIADGIIDPENDNLAPGTYTIVNEVSGPCVVADQDEMTFTVFDEIEIINFNDQECISAYSEFLVEWTTVGWDGSPTSNYNVNSVAQSSANFSDTISSPGNYSYTVTDDYGCSNIVLEGYRDCGCPSPGTMSSLSLVILCEGSCTGDSVSHNMDSIMQGGSMFEFF